MNTIYEKRGYIYVHDEQESYPDWLTMDFVLKDPIKNPDPYFLLNTASRKKFKEYYLPLIREGKYSISKQLLLDIRDFVQNPSYENNNIMITEFQGISLKKHQVKALTYMMQHKRFAFFYGTGTGKTLIAISYILSMKPKHVVILTPKKVIEQYKAECVKYIPGYFFSDDNTRDYTISIINYESVHKIDYDWIDCLILDESHKIKNATSNVNQNICVMALRSTNIYLFTGTPMDKHRFEIFPQFRILDERCYPTKTRFNYRYFNINEDYHEPTSEKREVSDELTQMILDYSIGVKTADVLALPPINFIPVQCSKPPDNIYKRLIEDRFITPPDKNHIIADTKAILRTKLQEICSGFIMNTDLNKTYDLAFRVAKLNILKQLIETTFDAGIIFTCFDKEIEYISKLLDTMQVPYGIIQGSTSDKDCASIIERLKQNQIKFVIANVKCTNAGLDLYFLNKILFYSMPDSYITYHQCCSRIYRHGQTKECYVYHLICKGSVEEQKYDALSKKKSYTNKLFSAY